MTPTTRDLAPLRCQLGHKAAGPVDPESTVLYEIISVLGDSKLPRDVDDIHDQLLETVHVKER